MAEEEMDLEAEPHQPDAREPEAPPPALPPGARRYDSPAPSSQASPNTRTPILAGILSIFPGLGNVYNGLYLRGITIFLIFMGLIALASGTRPPEAVIMIFMVIFVWLFNLFDAYRQATLINYGFTPDLDLAAKPRIPAWGSGGLAAGVAVFLVGFYGFLRERFDIDLSLLVDNWYLLFMVFGAILIVRTVIQRKRAEGESIGDDTAELD